MAYRCPACSRVILSRRNKLCGFCGEPLPAELLFTPAQIEEIEAAERARALASKLRAERRAEAAKRIADSMDFSGG
jgi:predicted amidophosphoribosyltransferase